MYHVPPYPFMVSITDHDTSHDLAIATNTEACRRVPYLMPWRIDMYLVATGLPRDAKNRIC